MTAMSSVPHTTQDDEVVVIHWKIGNATGHGSVVEAHIGQAWVTVMNEKYGTGTHWLGWH